MYFRPVVSAHVQALGVILFLTHWIFRDEQILSARGLGGLLFRQGIYTRPPFHLSTESWQVVLFRRVVAYRKRDERESTIIFILPRTFRT